MSENNVLSSFVLCAFVVLSGVAPVHAANPLTARDVRMQIETRWDYQPGQGPREYTEKGNMLLPSDPLQKEDILPLPPAEQLSISNPPRSEDRVPPRIYDAAPLKTKTSAEIGAGGSWYDYQEQDLGVKLSGSQIGINLRGTFDLGSSWFLRADGRVFGLPLRYEGSGVSESNPNYIAELRTTVGYDFLKGRFAVSPYLGLGYRYLYSDSRGVTSTGAYGYQRHSNYIFLPIGVQPRMLFDNGDRLVFTAEFDYLLRGWQRSVLSDVSISYPDIENKQRNGYGLHGDLMYETGLWSMGPYANYWNINQSTSDCGVGSGPTPYLVCGNEPHNTTLEYGLQLRYKFYGE